MGTLKRAAVRGWELTVRTARYLFSRTLKQLLVLAALFAAGCLLGAGLLVYALIIIFSRDLPDVMTMKNYRPPTVTTIYDRKNQVAAEYYVEKRVVLPYAEIPETIKKATLAIEDDKFFHHGGVDFMGIFRAAVVNLRAGEVVQGGSTITQQVAKVMFLSRERTFARKLKEFLLAREMERNFSKEEILEIYLNQIYYGHGCYGVEAAAQIYFDKGVKELTLGETALLAGLPKAPNSYSPFNNPKGALHRRDLVINRMLGSRYITKEEAEKAENEPLTLAQLKKTPNDVPYFAEHVRRHLYNKFGSEKLYQEGLKVYTTLDTAWQKRAQEALREGIEEDDRRLGWRGPVGQIDLSKAAPDWQALNPARKKTTDEEFFAKGARLKAVVRKVEPEKIFVEVNGVDAAIDQPWFAWAHPVDPKTDGRSFGPVKDATKLVKPGAVIEVKLLETIKKGQLKLMLDQEPVLQGALVCIDYGTGEMRALVGGYDFEKSSFNRAVQAYRQPGSAFKPVIYAAAMDKGFTPATIVIDSPLTLEGSEEEANWKPGNFGNEFYGPTTIRTGIIESRNIVSVKVLDAIGIRYLLEYAANLGITSKLEDNLSIALGSSGVSLLELTSVYGVIANQGLRNEPYFIRRIEDLSGRVIEAAEPQSRQAMPEDTAFLMTNVMTGVVEEGTGQAVRALGVPTAGKTGTTNDFNDAWFIGYTSGVVAGVWIGRDQEETIGRSETGGRAAAPIWLDFMRGVIGGLQIKPFVPPKNIVFARINKYNGALAAPDDPDSLFEGFREGTEPNEFGPKTANKKPAPAAH